MSFAQSMLVHIIEKELPKGTQDWIFFIEMRGEDDHVYRMEVYRPSNYTQVYLRKEVAPAQFSRPQLFARHDSAWRHDGIERILELVQPVAIHAFLSPGMGVQKITDGYFSDATPEK